MLPFPDMLLYTFLYALSFALPITLLVVLLFGWRRPAAADDDPIAWSIVFFGLLLFVASWGGGAWLAPSLPAHWGAPWLAYLFVALFVALLIGALLPGRRVLVTRRESLGWTALLASFGILFWVAIFVLAFVGVAASMT